MTETLILPETSDRATRYHALIPQIQALIQDEDDLIASLANTAAGLFQGLNVLWAGFYLVKHGGLVLGPFQGPIACTRIKLGDGVCGQSWAHRKTILSMMLMTFPGISLAQPPRSRRSWCRSLSRIKSSVCWILTAFSPKILATLIESHWRISVASCRPSFKSPAGPVV